MDYDVYFVILPNTIYPSVISYTLAFSEPVGKYFIQVCTTTPCQLCGSTKVMEAIQNELGISAGHTTADGQFTLVEVECAGACVNGPVIAINDDYYVSYQCASLLFIDFAICS